MGKIVVLGAGCAGLAAAYELKQKNLDAVVYEKNAEYGGLCRSFMIDGFTFDTFRRRIIWSIFLLKKEFL